MKIYVVLRSVLIEDDWWDNARTETYVVTATANWALANRYLKREGYFLEEFEDNNV